MIVLDRVGVTYPGAARPTLRDVSLTVPEGELCLVVGRTGSGKSTLLGTINGLVPHFTGGTLHGRVSVDGRDTRLHPPRELADVVGFVGQDPGSTFVADRVEDELAYTMEQLAVPGDVMRRRVEEILDLLGLADVRDRPVADLSMGQQQRVAIGAVLTAHPRILVLDEPTSALDPAAAEEVLAAITRLVHDLGVTVVLAEHRLERVVQYADRVVHLRPDGTVDDGTPEHILEQSSVAPPIVELGRLRGWTPLPLSIRDARRRAGPLRSELGGATPRVVTAPQGEVLLSARRLVVSYGQTVALREVDLDLRAGEVTAVMGRNGAGKSSLLWALQGAGPRSGGSVVVAGSDPRDAPAARAREFVCLVPHNPGDLLYLESVQDECATADRGAGKPEGSCRELLDRLVPGIDADAHPRDLSEGQRLALVLAIQLVAGPRVVLLDEPTRGLDYAAKAQLAGILATLAIEGRTVLLATHDVEFVAQAAQRVVVLADGEIVSDGPTAEVTVSSPVFAPQVAKILHPQTWLTVDGVRAGLAAAGSAGGRP